MCMAVEQRNSRQIVAQAGLKIVEVVGWCDLHRAGAEFPIHQNWVSHDWDSAVSQRQLDLLPDEAVVTWVFWVDAPPYCPFPSHTRWMNRSRPSLSRVVPSARSCFSTTFCVAMPAWSVPGTQRVFRPCMRRQRIKMS